MSDDEAAAQFARGLFGTAAREEREQQERRSEIGRLMREYAGLDDLNKPDDEPTPEEQDREFTRQLFTPHEGAYGSWGGLLPRRRRQD